MPNKTVADILERLHMLESKMQLHLEESGSIKTDLNWLKRAFWGLVAILTASLGAILRFIAVHVQWH